MSGTEAAGVRLIRKGRVMSAAEIVEKALRDNPGIATILEAAERARRAESQQVPVDIGATSEVVANPTSSQCLVPLVTFDPIRRV
jgi:hypothetical protein